MLRYLVGKFRCQTGFNINSSEHFIIVEEYDPQAVTHINQKCQNIKFPFNELDAKTNRIVKKFMIHVAFPRL